MKLIGLMFPILTQRLNETSIIFSPAMDWQLCDNQCSLVDNLYNTSRAICATFDCCTDLLYTALPDQKQNRQSSVTTHA